MPTLSPNVYVLDRKSRRVVYESKSIAQAQGFADARERASIIAFSAERCATEWTYQICIIDSTTGQTVLHGPIVDLPDALELVLNLRVVILPVLDHTKAGVIQ